MELSTVFVLPLAFVFAMIAMRGLGEQERRYATGAFAAHIAFTFVQWALYWLYFGGGDMTGYVEEWGALLAKLVDADAVRFFPEVLKLIFHQEINIPFEIPGEGSSTGTMSGLGCLIVLVFGPSVLTACVLATWFSWYGQLCLYRVAREELPKRHRRAALIGLLLVPSVIYWGAGYVKEGLVVGFFGLFVKGLWTLVRRRDGLQLPLTVIGACGVALLKPHTLVAFVIAAAAFVYADRSWRSTGTIRMRPGYLVLAVVLGAAGLSIIGTFFPGLRTDQVAQSVAQSQGAWQAQRDAGFGGGSDVAIGDADASSPAQQLVYVPIAFINSFFRPMPFEARGLPMIGASMESTLLLAACLSLLRADARRRVLDVVLRTPFLVFSIVFCIVFGVGVGLATGNLGSLSRYRVPMMPFYATTVLILRERQKSAVAPNGRRPPDQRSLVLRRTSRLATS